MKKELFLICLLFVTGCESKQATKNPSQPAKTPSPNSTANERMIPVNAPIEGVIYSGGDGSSIEQAVIIKAPDKYTGYRGELYWLKKNRPGWHLERQSVLKSKTGEKTLDKMIFKTPQGDLKTVFFNVTDFANKK